MYVMVAATSTSCKYEPPNLSARHRRLLHAMFATNPHECIRNLYMAPPTGGRQMLKWDGRNQGTNKRWERPASCAQYAGCCWWWAGEGH
jgi:hypothetical protein